jgi:hypothetical protein
LIEDTGGKYGFFDLELEFADKTLEIWKCDIYDDMMVFDDPNNQTVSRFFSRCGVGEVVVGGEHHIDGYIYSNLPLWRKRYSAMSMAVFVTGGMRGCNQTAFCFIASQK